MSVSLQLAGLTSVDFVTGRDISIDLVANWRHWKTSNTYLFRWKSEYGND